MEDESLEIPRVKLHILYKPIIKEIDSKLTNPPNYLKYAADYSKYNKIFKKLTMKLDKCSIYISINEHTNEIENIFTYTDSDGNNLLLYCCKKNIPELCNYIINYYGNKFDIGSINNDNKTALIISIQNNMFDVATNLISAQYLDDHTETNIGQIDNSNKNALDYMLEKVTTDENDKIQVAENAVIVENKGLIADLFKFYLRSLNYNSIAIRRNPIEFGSVYNYGIAENYIEIFCKDLYFWKPILEKEFEYEYDEIMKFTTKFCKEKKTAESSINTGKSFTGRKRNINSLLSNATILNNNRDNNRDSDETIEMSRRNSYELYHNLPSEIIPLRHVDVHKYDYGDDYRERNPIPRRNLPVYFPPSKHTQKKQRTRSPDKKNRDPNIEREFTLGGSKKRSRNINKNKSKKYTLRKNQKNRNLGVLLYTVIL
jgi:hypothetical protein